MKSIFPTFDEVDQGYCVYVLRGYRGLDDEEPDCMLCDNCQYDDLCKECGPEHWWYYYRREEKNKILE